MKTRFFFLTVVLVAALFTYRTVRGTSPSGAEVSVDSRGVQSTNVPTLLKINRGSEPHELYLPLLLKESDEATPTETVTPTGTSVATATPMQDGPTIAGCPLLPANNIWNTPIDTLPVDPHSQAYVNTIGADDNLHPDFGSGEWEGAPIGIPYVEVSGSQPMVQVAFEYDDESDAGPYPIPPDAPIEGGSESDGDRHVLVVERDNCVLYELYDAFPQSDGNWSAGSGAIFDFNSNALRPDSWTSADAAGLPILPGLLRYEELASGEIRHALRFTVPQTRRAYVWPARHYASSLTDEQYPPMGQRFRLKADYDISGFSPEIQIILRALKQYGLILADNGSPWFISGVPDERWDNDMLRELRTLTGADLEAVDVSSLMIDSDSGEARQPAPTPSTLTPTSTAIGTATPTSTPTGAASTTPINTPVNSTPTATPTSTSSAGGYITYTQQDGQVYRIAAQEAATPENISTALDGLATGSNDAQLNISPDGAWLTLSTERFDQECVGWACLALVSGDLSSGDVVRANGAVIHPEGLSAVASGGNLIVYPHTDGPHNMDLWAVTRSNGNWNAPQLLTSDSPYAYNNFPAISANGSQVIFECGNDSFPSRALCEVASDGTAFRVVLTQTDSPPGFPDTGALHHPDYAPDGTIVFEGDWGGEQIWRLPVGATEPVRITSEFNNDNSPCVLPDGRIASLWLDRPAGSGVHEIKVMAADGSSYVMVLSEQDVFDVGMGCGASF